MTAPTPPAPPSVLEPTWYTIALAEVGVQELQGLGDNPRIQEYLRCVGHVNAHDEIPWCSAFCNWVMGRAGLVGTQNAMARSWLHWGQPLVDPRIGCIVVFSRDSASAQSGHVGLYAGEAGDFVRVLGGNQRNRVCVSPYHRSRLLGLRWPKLRAS